MEIDKLINGYKVRSFPWIDGKNIYVNVQYFKPGASLNQPPTMDKSALVLNTPAGKQFVYEFTSTCVEYIAKLEIPIGGMAHITA